MHLEKITSFLPTLASQNQCYENCVCQEVPFVFLPPVLIPFLFTPFHPVFSLKTKFFGVSLILTIFLIFLSYMTWSILQIIFFKNVWQIEYICIQNRQFHPSCLCSNYHNQVNTNMYMFVYAWWGQVNRILCYFHLTIYPVNYFIASRDRASSYFYLYVFPPCSCIIIANLHLYGQFW